jgi:hypothetical protein
VFHALRVAGPVSKGNLSTVLTVVMDSMLWVEIAFLVPLNVKNVHQLAAHRATTDTLLLQT